MPLYIREEQIESEVASQELSTLSAKEYIQRYGASFSLAQFYRYRDNLSREGITGLKDKLQSGNNQKLNSFEKTLNQSFIKNKPYVMTEEAQQAFAFEFGTQIHRGTMSRILKRLGVTKAQNEQQMVKSVRVSNKGFELIALKSYISRLAIVPGTMCSVSCRKKTFRFATEQTNR